MLINISIDKQRQIRIFPTFQTANRPVTEQWSRTKRPTHGSQRFVC